MKSGKESKQVKSTDYVIYHSKKMIQGGFKIKTDAMNRATELMSKHKVS